MNMNRIDIRSMHEVLSRPCQALFPHTDFVACMDGPPQVFYFPDIYLGFKHADPLVVGTLLENSATQISLLPFLNGSME